MVRDEILGLKILWVAVVIGMIIMGLKWLYNAITAIPGLIYSQLTNLPAIVWLVTILLVLGTIAGYIETKYKERKRTD